MQPQDLSSALRAVINVLDIWNITKQDRLVLLGCDQKTYDDWVGTTELSECSPDTLERLSYILGIWSALAILFPDHTVADSWIHRPNSDPEFSGQTPFSVMKQHQTEGLSRVRRCLDACCN